MHFNVIIEKDHKFARKTVKCVILQEKGYGLFLPHCQKISFFCRFFLTGYLARKTNFAAQSIRFCVFFKD